MMISGELHENRTGATDSEALFLLAIAEAHGWEAIPPGSWAEILAEGLTINPFRPMGVPLAA